MTSLPPSPTMQQRLAADPAASAWVTASAGTGKTRVLADRVLRLLMAGTPPERVLCITFTKAAAAEMLERVGRDLATFAVEPDERCLVLCLERLTGELPDPATIARARRLFAQVLDLPGGMAIQTIHGFCQALLRRFPLEAGVPPHFEVIDERTTAELLREAREEVLAREDPGLAPHLTLLAVALDESTLAGALAEVISRRSRLGGDLDDLVARVFDALQAPRELGERDLDIVACADGAFDASALRAAVEALRRGGAGDLERAATIHGWLEAPAVERFRTLARYRGAFLTKGCEPQARLATQRAAAALPALAAEAARLAALEVTKKAVAVARRTEALLRVAGAVIAGYERRKREAALLDYEDLIERARALLRRPGIAPWVLFKLDGGLDHLLIDEGQDTSPAQWDIVLALTEEFFAGEGARDAGRTLFVIGDEKQSIYSFQGAELVGFQRLRALLRARAEAAGQLFREVTLDLSFRSTEAVLAAVDAVFAKPEAGDGVVSGDGPLVHRSNREGEAGLVELWPLLPPAPAPGSDDDWLPTERLPEDDPKARLAQLVAATVAGWIERGERLEAAGRAIRPGDVLVLLPRRGAVQSKLVRAFKARGVPVAGADRMALTEQLAVMDLMALGDALLLPEDDLTLAALLKSPLFGVDEDELFALAHGRGAQTLLARLRALAPSSPRLAAMLERFEALRRQADFLPPFELYARLLGEGGGRRALLARLGPDARDPVEEFLAQALAFERGHAGSLQGFLQWLRMEAAEVKRDPEQPRDEVRIMTVHGAKGLEAPVVFLADCMYEPRPQDRLLWRESDGLPLWKASSRQRDPISDAAVAAATERQRQEFRRLLYVALTRARDRLYVCGWMPGKRPKEPTWHDHVQAGLLAHPLVERTAMPGLEGEVLRLRSRQARPTAAAAGDSAVAVPPPPVWLARPPPPEPLPARPLSPSRPSGEEPPASSPFVGDGRRFRRGRVVHRLLQLLPELPQGEREAALERLLARPGLGLAADERAAIGREVLAVLGHPELAAVFGPGGRAEQPLVGLVGDTAVSGQIDRLLVGEREVVVVDYKTNRAPPAAPAEVAPAHLRQMAAYRALLARIWPGRKVRCVLVWTESARVMSLPPSLLDPHMPEAGRPPPGARLTPARAGP